MAFPPSTDRHRSIANLNRTPCKPVKLAHWLAAIGAARLRGLLRSPTAANGRRRSSLSEKRPRTHLVWRALHTNWRGALVMESTAESIVIHDNVTSSRFEWSSATVRGGLASRQTASHGTRPSPRAISSISERCPIQTAFNEKSYHVTSTSGEPILCNGCRYVEWSGQLLQKRQGDRRTRLPLRINTR